MPLPEDSFGSPAVSEGRGNRHIPWRRLCAWLAECVKGDGASGARSCHERVIEIEELEDRTFHSGVGVGAEVVLSTLEGEGGLGEDHLHAHQIVVDSIEE